MVKRHHTDQAKHVETQTPPPLSLVFLSSFLVIYNLLSGYFLFVFSRTMSYRFFIWHTLYNVSPPPPSHLPKTVFVFNRITQAIWDVFVAFFIVFSVVEVTFRLGFDAPAVGR